MNGRLLGLEITFLMVKLAALYTLITMVCNRPSDEMNNYFTLYLFIWEIMNIIAINGHEISLGGLVNLHEKTVYTHNGLFAKINKYYEAIIYGPLLIMDFNDLRLLFYSFSHFQVFLHVKIGIFYLTLY